MDLEFWTTKLQEAERELKAATTRSAVDLAARRLMRIKAELKALEQRSTRRGSGVAASAASS